MIQLALLLVFAVSLFIFGFFPVSNNIVDIDTELPENLDNYTFNVNESYHSHANKTVLIVIDALRWDFVTPKLMPLTSSLINISGCVSKIQVESPTVTLPRIKALTTGNIPQYIDVVRNLASSEVLVDSWLHSARKGNLKIVFYGDNTWEKLFPDIFTRSEGTTSFFVWDFTEVDNNVTRNVDVELARDDWDIMILHYLGLDHIGHVLGPFSPRIALKLQEMDEIIYRVHKTLSEKGQIVSFITGDHGMRDSGGHGGTTQPEIIVPLISLGVKCQNSSFFQTDIPANIASLLGVEIPSTSIGNLQKSLLDSLSLKQYLYACYYNINLLLKKVKMSPESCYDARHSYKEFVRTGVSSGLSGGGPQGCSIFSIRLNLTRALASFSAIAK
ncbi:hypothetical protein GWI33_013749 [Rhynchophorus ferrugineus]|uniref:GPI ethanolamine phosphate transferase 2 n=1 Tax=Rhynchophorus ferrugineus TaxID=354439 RepID=A0A834IGG4_RHYFE|nr:hypothetical protein GWI33_013749 [Rhynchophorus ferrugineus]